jgi:ribosome-associated protein
VPRSSSSSAPTTSPDDSLSHISEVRTIDADTAPLTTTDWALIAARAADHKGGADTVVLDVGDILAITEAFVITSAGNSRLVKALVDEVEHVLTDAGGPKPRRVEGLGELEWVLMDFGDFLVHVFLDETRRFYELERLWSDVPRLEWATAGT